MIALKTAKETPVRGNLKLHIELTVVKVEVEVDDAQDKKTHEIPSILGDAGKQHFVTAKGTGNVCLKVKVTPDDQSIKDLITWESDNSSIFLTGNKEKISFSRDTTSGEKVPLKIKLHNRLFWQGVSWIVWISITPDYSIFTNELHYNNEYSLEDFTIGVDHLGLSNKFISFNSAIEWRGVISPKEIIENKDIPALDGFLEGFSYANRYWDMYREKKVKAWIDDVETDENYPVNTLRRSLKWISDDYSLAGEDNNPYNGRRDKLDGPPTCEIFSYDNPRVTTSALDSIGAKSSFMRKIIFREFARIRLKNTWYRCSDYGYWRSFRALIKKNDTWIEDNSEINIIDDSNEDFK